MITRFLQQRLARYIKQFPAVAILGPRQVGKTTLAKALAATQKKTIIYIDLESRNDISRLHDAEAFFMENKNALIILDEIQRMPELFAVLRPVIDDHRKPGRFIITGSASPHLVKGVSESLAGRIAYTELSPVGMLETKEGTGLNTHWFRGGYPKALLAKGNENFCHWMDFFIRSYIERDLSELFDINFTRSVMHNFWRMLAHSNGAILNSNSYARALGVTAPTISRYLDFLEGAYIIHKLPAYYFNAKKRLIKAPKVYIRDSGMLHRLGSVNKFSDLRGNPLIGSSWEGYVVEQIYQYKPPHTELYYYRTQNGAEADVVITIASKPVACIEIKYNNAPALSKGFHESISDLKTKNNFVITPQNNPYPYDKTITVCGLQEFLKNYLPKF